MNHDTYEVKENRPQERYEWDRTWIEQTGVTDRPRCFYLGDSISWGVRPIANRMIGDRVLFDALGTSKALDNPFLRPTIDLFREQIRTPSLVILNSGLHGWHLSDDEDYPSELKSMLLFLQSRFPQIPLAVVLTTRVANPERQARVLLRNEAARRVAAELSLPVIDLYSPSEVADLQTDGVHFNDEGYGVLAKVLAENVLSLLSLS